MAQTYVELRKVASGNNDSIAADIARHLYARQYLGKVVVICDQPIILLSAARKQWLKLSRTLQRQRSSTLNADKILKYTHGIAHMQRLRFTAKMPMEQPEADVFFLQPHHTQLLPAQCLSVYIADRAPVSEVRHILSQLPADALVVDYVQRTDWATLGTEPKPKLEARVRETWQQVRQFLEMYGIDISELHKNEMHNVEAMDDALDTLLGVSHKFLSVASEFQHALELARPMRIHKTLHERYDSFILLAHRVQALTPGAFKQQFLQVYNEDDTFLMYDHSQEHLVHAGETLQEGLVRHSKAGRIHLARALHHYIGRSLSPTR